MRIRSITRILAVVGLLGALVVPATGAYADPVAECQVSTANQVETGLCLVETFNAAEAVENSALERAQEEADALDQVTGRVVARPALDHSQSLWLEFRTANCQVPAAFAGGASGADQFALACQINMTRARTVELNALGG